MFSEVPGTFEFEWKVENVFLGSEASRFLDSPVFRIGFLDQSTWFIRFRPGRKRNGFEWHRCDDHVICKGRTFKVSTQVQIRRFPSGAILEEWSGEKVIDSETPTPIVFFDSESIREQLAPSPDIETLTVLFLVRNLTSHDNASTRMNPPQMHIPSMTDLSLSWQDHFGRVPSFLPERSDCCSRSNTMQKVVSWTMDKMKDGERRVLILKSSLENSSTLKLSAINESGQLHLGVEKISYCIAGSDLRMSVGLAEDPECFVTFFRFDKEITSHGFDTGIQLDSVEGDSFQLKIDIKESNDNGACHPDRWSRFLTKRPNLEAVLAGKTRSDMLNIYRDRIGSNVKLKTSCGRVFYGHRDFLAARSLKFKALLQAKGFYQKEPTSSSLKVMDEPGKIFSHSKTIDPEKKSEVDEKKNTILKSKEIGIDNDALNTLSMGNFSHTIKGNLINWDLIQRLSKGSTKEASGLENPLSVINSKQVKELSNSKEIKEVSSSLKEIDIRKNESETISPDELTSDNEDVSTIEKKNKDDTQHSVDDTSCENGEDQNFQQNLNSELNTLDISDLDAETLEFLLIYLYSASLKEELELHSLLKIYEAGYLYHVHFLQILCRERLERILDTKTTAMTDSVLYYANKYKDKQLIELCK